MMKKKLIQNPGFKVAKINHLIRHDCTSRWLACVGTSPAFLAEVRMSLSTHEQRLSPTEKCLEHRVAFGSHTVSMHVYVMALVISYSQICQCIALNKLLQIRGGWLVTVLIFKLCPLLCLCVYVKRMGWGMRFTPVLRACRRLKIYSAVPDGPKEPQCLRRLLLGF